MNVHGQWYLPWMQTAGQVVIPQQPQTHPQQPLSNSVTQHAVSATTQQQQQQQQQQYLQQQQYIQQQQQLLKYLNQAGQQQQQQQQQQQSYLNFGGFLQPQQPQPQALINPASYIGLAAAAQAQHQQPQPQPQIPISSLAVAASKLPLLRTPSTALLSSKVRLAL